MTPAPLAASVHAGGDEQPRRLVLLRRHGRAPVPVRVALAARQPIVRAGLRVVLEREERITVTGEAATAEEALALAVRMRRGVVLVDSALPGLDRLEMTRRIRAKSGVAVLFVDASDAAPAELVQAVLRSRREYRRPTVTEIRPVARRANLRLVTHEGR
ncbi:MAG: LuxR family transcriptional regulator [Solirubrobacterales bacterium]|jgi:CheY-like chemotaxis protein|nr:LuxR family transcriptional regulator [Solirubrobacterales bacterium]